MKRPSFKTFFLTSIAVLTMFVIGSLSQEWGFPNTSFPLEKGEKIKMDEAGATQTFRTSKNNLSGINTLFGGSSIKNGGTLSLVLLDEKCETTIREERRFITEINADNSVDFHFSRIPDSAEKVFCFKTSFAPEKGSKKAFIFAISNTMPNEKLSLSINNEARPGESLALRPVYRGEKSFADLATLNQRISQYKPWFLKDIFLATLAILSIGLSCGFLLLVTHLKEADSKK